MSLDFSTLTIYYHQAQEGISYFSSQVPFHNSHPHKARHYIYETSNQALAGTQRGNDEVMNKLMNISQPSSYQQ